MDSINKENEDGLVSIGYTGVLKISLAAQWLEDKYPKSVFRDGYRLWREDHFEKAKMKFPYFRDYNERRNYIIKLAIEEIQKNG